jgi:hypothetical protein
LTENDLYNLGCDLVEAAGGIARCVAEPGADAGRAVPAVLGCVEAALKELHAACIALERLNGARSSDGVRERVAADRLDRGYANLGVALQDARDASAAARSLAARRAALSAGRVG